MIRLRTVAPAILCALALAGAAAELANAQSREATAALETNLAVERKLLGRDVAAHAEARLRERRELAVVADAAGRLDQLLAGQDLTIAGFERVQAELVAATETARATSVRVEELRGRMAERLRRIGALQEELLTGRRGTPDPLSGRWRVRFFPQDRDGTFVLRLDGTLVQGEYQLAGGPAGSLRGMLVNNILRLERIDARTGFDMNLLGRIDAPDRLSGTWHGTELAAGRPASGEWTAVRLPTPQP
jgi:hypothetical protein